MSILFFLTNSLYTTDSEVISYVSYRQIKDNKLALTDSIVIQINNPKGENATYISIPYSKNEKLNINDVWIEDMGGKIVRKLKDNEFSDHSAIPDYSIYTDQYVKTVQIRHNQYPYRIVYSYRKTRSDFLGIYWSPFLSNNQDVKYARLVIDVPNNDYPTRYKYENIGEPVIQTISDRKIYSWETSYEYIEGQSFAPSSELKIPEISFLPINFKYDIKGSWENWVSFGNWICKLNEKATILPVTEKQKVNELITGINDPVEKIRVLYKYMQKHTRYINVSLKTGGMKTYPAEYVTQNKYGDCKALSTYMISLLEQAGIKAYYTLIKSGRNIEPIDKNFPSQVFDHVIVTIPMEKDTLFLECTDKDIPMGYLGTFTQGREALVIKENGSYFIQTPELKPEGVNCSSSMNIFINGNIITNKLNTELKGYAYEILNYYASNYHKKEIEKISRNFIYSTNYDFESLSIKRKSDDIPEILFEAQIKGLNSVNFYGKNLVLTSFPLSLTQLESPEERTQSLQLNYPISRNDTIHYNFNEINFTDKKPENISIQSPYGNYSVKFDFNGKQLSIIKNLLIFKGLYFTQEYENFYSFWSSIQTHENKNYYLEIK